VRPILEALEAAHAGEEPVGGSGPREREKHPLVSEISNVATALFLAGGFGQPLRLPDSRGKRSLGTDRLQLFPTKESMFFDRSESNVEALADAVRHRGRESLGEVVVNTLSAASRWTVDGMDEAHSLRPIPPLSARWPGKLADPSCGAFVEFDASPRQSAHH